MNCPWHNFQQDTMRFCEADVCALVRFPADSYSMIVLLLVSLFILRRARQDGVLIAAIGSIGLFLVAGSFIYHATGTYFGQMLDLAGMFMFGLFYLLFNAARLVPMSGRFFTLLFGISVLLSLLVLHLNQQIGIYMFSVQISVAILLEYRLFRRSRFAINYRPLIQAYALFAVGYLFWLLDYHRILCNPANHLLTGHSLWHILCGLVFFYSYRYIRQFKANDLFAQK